ncbi:MULTISPECIES: hypothetical protein [Nocardia]|uniref:Uncharacterized protein n=1 Tax=Nocardia coubleae TaxID=356147 RepID=A0A846WHM0_9NOCA|nr:MULTISPECIES: hypothetical protein [Nocardia]NKX91608.1 hypothetical protein [Nocardia coubleae]
MPAGKQRRSKRDPESSRRLDEVQKLMKARREAARRRETATMDAVQTYLHAAGAIRQRTGIHEQRLGELHKRIEQLEREYDAEVTQLRGQQAGAVTAMRELGETDASIGALLELTSKQLRQLTALARAAENPAAGPGGQDDPSDVQRRGLLTRSDVEVGPSGPQGALSTDAPGQSLA